QRAEPLRVHGFESDDRLFVIDGHVGPKGRGRDGDGVRTTALETAPDSASVARDLLRISLGVPPCEQEVRAIVVERIAIEARALEPARKPQDIGRPARS